MTAQPNQSQFQPQGFSGAPPAPSGASRLLPLMRTAATGGLLIALVLYGAQIVLPHDFKPSVVAGRAAGDTVAGETEAMQAMKLSYERKLADATAQANAKAQTDVIAIQAAAAARTESLKPVSDMAGLADVLCMGSRALSGATEPPIWGRGSNDDLHTLAQGTSNATCGVGEELRQGVTASQLQAIQETAAARGAPLTNGATATTPVDLAPVQPAPTPAPIQAATPRTLDEVYALAQPSRHYGWPEVMKARAYIRTLPQPVQERLFANLDDNNGTGWDVLVDRTRAYVVVANLN